jgi:hypothetical protein
MPCVLLTLHVNTRSADPCPEGREDLQEHALKQQNVIQN